MHKISEQAARDLLREILELPADVEPILREFIATQREQEATRTRRLARLKLSQLRVTPILSRIFKQKGS